MAERSDVAESSQGQAGVEKPAGTTPAPAEKGDAAPPTTNGGNSTTSKGRQTLAAYQWVWVIPLFMALGVVAVAIYAAAFHSWTVFGFAVGVSAAAIIVGGLVGFVFGIPLSPKTDGTAANQYQGNSNLEQVSDWLTKILVGVGLVQLGRATSGLSRLAQSLAPGFGGHNSSAAFGLAITIFFAGTGFLYLYLWSRTGFLLELRSIDAVKEVARAEAVKAAVPTAKEAALPVAQQASHPRVDALQSELQSVSALVDKALYPRSGSDTPSEAQLTEAIVNATPYARQQAFQAAEYHRRRNWETDPETMALVIPVFRALIASDIDGKFHRNHGELGFALSDSRPPQTQEAQGELTKAIEIRGTPASEKGWAAYEGARAMCRIRLDPDFLAGRQTSDASSSVILADLAVAAQEPFARGYITKNLDVQRWLRLNSQLSGVDPTWIVNNGEH